MKIKVSEASGPVLDWMVAKCEETLGVRPNTCRDCQHHEERAITDGSEHICHLSFLNWAGSYGCFDDHPFGAGISVEYGVHQNCPIDTNTAPPYSTNWAQGGPIIEREGITTAFCSGDLGEPRSYWVATAEQQSWQVGYGPYHVIDEERSLQVYKSQAVLGPTPLIAAMRCFISSKLGEEVDVPDALTS